MTDSRLPCRSLILLLGALSLASCATSFGQRSAEQANLPPTIRAADIAGRWGYAAYYNETDRPRVEAAARRLCNQPIEIRMGPSGGIIMPLATQQRQPQELVLKGAPGGRNFIGPPGQSIGPQDSEILSFDGQVLLVRTATNDEIGRLTSIYVRCPARS